jgi:acyl-CoA synthetase (AMP-forming)/AMP-acid ligase II
VSSFADVVRQAAQRHGDKPLYVTPEGQEFSYAELDRLSDEVAVGLGRRGVREGDVVALLIPSGAAYAVCYAAAAKTGAITAGVNERLSDFERAKCIALADPRIVIGAAAGPSSDLDAVTKGRLVEVTAAGSAEAGGEVPTQELLSELRGGARTSPPEIGEDPERPVAVVFTSGTTGQPKGAVFANRQLDAVSNADGRMAWGGGGRGLSNTSFAHVGYMTKLPQTLRSGGTTYLMKRWTAGDAIELVQRHRITTLGGIPTQMELMLRHDSFDKADLSSVKLVVLGGSSATAALVRETRKRLGVPVLVRYTCTEAGVGTGTDIDDPPEDAEETVGRARPGVEVTVRDDAHRSLPGGETGNVCLRSAAVMSGYFGNEDATTAVFTEDGALRTGDMGFFDERGRLHLTGRSSEMYVRGGYNVFPAEVEDALCDHPLVAHVAVAPRSDPVMGEIGVAVVVARRGDELPDLESLRGHARRRLASYKLPEDLVFVTELPRTAMDKVDRRALVQFVANSR